jgi:hypothetical protein
MSEHFVQTRESPGRCEGWSVKHRFQFSLAALMSVVTACCILCALAKTFGVVGIAAFVCFILILFWQASVFEFDTLFGIPAPRMSFLLLCVLLLVTLAALGLFLGPQIRH